MSSFVSRMQPEDTKVPMVDGWAAPRAAAPRWFADRRASIRAPRDRLDQDRLRRCWICRQPANRNHRRPQLAEAADIPQVDNPEAAGMLAGGSTAQSSRAPPLQGQSQNSR